MDTKQKRDVFLGGSYTVEAAFLVPIILGIFFAWLFQLFYLHDQVIINGMLKEAVVGREETLSSSDGEVQAGIQSHLWLMDIVSFQVKRDITKTKYVLRSEAVWNIPVMKPFLKRRFVYQTDVETVGKHPERYVRLREKGG